MDPALKIQPVWNCDLRCNSLATDFVLKRPRVGLECVWKDLVVLKYVIVTSGSLYNNSNSSLDY